MLKKIKNEDSDSNLKNNISCEKNKIIKEKNLENKIINPIIDPEWENILCKINDENKTKNSDIFLYSSLNKKNLNLEKIIKNNLDNNENNILENINCSETKISSDISIISKKVKNKEIKLRKISQIKLKKDCEKNSNFFLYNIIIGNQLYEIQIYTNFSEKDYNNLPKKMDGSLDMRLKVNKDYLKNLIHVIKNSDEEN